MRRGDEDHPAHERQRADEEGALQELARLRAHVQLVDGLPADGVPDARARIDRGHLGEQAPLAVPDHDHLAQRGVRALGIELRHRLGERIAEQHGGVRDRTAGGVVEEPELEPIAHAAVVLEIVEHVGPSAGARQRAVDEHHRDATGPERLREGEAGGQLLAQQIAEEEPPALPAPLLRLAQRPRQRRGRLDLEPDLAAVDLDGSPIGVAVDLERRVQHRLRQLAAGIVDAQERGHRRPGVRTEEVRRVLVRVGGDRPGRERRADPRSPVARAEAPHPELGDGHELDQLAVGPAQRIRVEVHRDLLPEGQGIEAGAQLDHRAIGGRERSREPAVVEVGGDAQARIELVRRLAGAAGEQERPGGDRRLEIVVPLPRVLGVGERQLRQREQRVSRPRSWTTSSCSLLEGALGVPPEALGQVPAVQDVLAEEAGRRSSSARCASAPG